MLSDFQRSLLAWFRDEGRDLPWRRTRDPWAVLVAETMLQQTQVPRVVPKFLAFMERYGTPDTCARASEGDIIRSWDGLGFNRRALALHRAARMLVEQHDGEMPETYEEIVALPGVGPYTARAVLAFAHESDHGVLDTNVARILARAIAGEPLVRREAQSLADTLVPSGQAWAWNQAMLDLGATVCRKSNPRCLDCPVRQQCAWQASGSLVDPAVGTAGVSMPQSTFAGSDRQGRGRLVKALRQGPVHPATLEDVVGWVGDRSRIDRVVNGLLTDGLICREEDGTLSLP